MSWGRVDDRFPEHRKWCALEERHGVRAWADAMAIWLVVLCYANRNETDGEIPTATLTRLTPLGRGAVRAMEAMVDVGLAEKTETGFRLHDFTLYNPSRAEKEEQRRADAERKRRSRGGVTPPGVPPMSGPDTPRTPPGVPSDSTGSPSGVQSSARPHARVRAPASRPVPSRPVPEEISTGDARSDLQASVGDAPPIPPEPDAGADLEARARRMRGLFVAEYRRVWESEPSRLAWMGAGQHAAALDSLASWLARNENGEALIAPLVAGYFASGDPYVRKARWSIGLLARDPGRYLPGGSSGWKPPAKSYADVDASLDKLMEGQ